MYTLIFHREVFERVCDRAGIDRAKAFPWVRDLLVIENWIEIKERMFACFEDVYSHVKQHVFLFFFFFAPRSDLETIQKGVKYSQISLLLFTKRISQKGFRVGVFSENQRKIIQPQILLPYAI
jgi:hypothetical protein